MAAAKSKKLNSAEVDVLINALIGSEIFHMSPYLNLPSRLTVQNLRSPLLRKRRQSRWQ